MEIQRNIENERTRKAFAEKQQKELERRKKLAEEIAKKSLEAIKKRQYEERITNFNYICKWGPNNIPKIQKLINDGLDLTESSAFCSVSTLIKQGRSSKFINFLIEKGLIIKESEKAELKILEKTEIEQDNQLLKIMEISEKLREFTNGRYDFICFY